MSFLQKFITKALWRFALKGLPFLGQVALTTGPQEFLVRMCLNIALPLSMSVSVFE